MSKIISDTIQGRSKDPNVNAGLTVAGVTTATGVINASSDVRISGNINAGIASFTSIAGDGSALTGVANTDFIVSVAQTTSRLTVNSDANIVGVSTFTGTTTLGQVTLGIGKSINFGNTQKAFIQGHSVGLGTTTVAGRKAGLGTATGTLIMIADGISPKENNALVISKIQDYNKKRGIKMAPAKRMMRKQIREMVKKLIMEMPTYSTAAEAKNNCWMGNGDCLDGNGNMLACSQSLNIQTNTFSNTCGAPIQGGGGTMTPGKDVRPSRPMKPKMRRNRRR